MFAELHNHSAGENIGLRSDLVRLLYGILYSDNVEETKRGQKAEINIHIDIDALGAINSEKAGRQQGKSHVNQLDALQRAKLELQSMHKSLERMKLPAKPEPLSREEVAALADRPQKSWSVYSPEEKSAGAPVVIPDKLHRRGYMIAGLENDLLAMVPSHQKAVMVAKQTHHLLKAGKYNRKFLADQGLRSAPSLYDKPVQDYAKLFHTLNTGEDMPNLKALDQQRILDYFRLAEKIRQMKPALQEKMDALTIAARDETRTKQERNIDKMRIEALASIYDAAAMLVESFVNKTTFSPQIVTASREMSIDFLRFPSSVFGMVKQRAFTSNLSSG